MEFSFMKSWKIEFLTHAKRWKFHQFIMFYLMSIWIKLKSVAFISIWSDGNRNETKNSHAHIVWPLNGLHHPPKTGILINGVDRMSENVNDVKRDNAKVENDGHHGNWNNNNHGLICPHAGRKQPTCADRNGLIQRKRPFTCDLSHAKNWFFLMKYFQIQPYAPHLITSAKFKLQQSKYACV